MAPQCNYRHSRTFSAIIIHPARARSRISYKGVTARLPVSLISDHLSDPSIIFGSIKETNVPTSKWLQLLINALPFHSPPPARFLPLFSESSLDFSCLYMLASLHTVVSVLLLCAKSQTPSSFLRVSSCTLSERISQNALLPYLLRINLIFKQSLLRMREQASWNIFTYGKLYQVWTH